MKTEDAFVLGCRVSLRETARLALSDIEAERWSADEIAALNDWIATHGVPQSPLLEAGGRS